MVRIPGRVIERVVPERPGGRTVPGRIRRGTIPIVPIIPVPGIPMPAVIIAVPGIVIPGAVPVRSEVPHIPGAECPGILIQPDRGIHHHQFCAGIEQNLLTCWDHQGVSLIVDDIGLRAFALGQKIIHFGIRHGYFLNRDSSRTGVDTVIVDLCPELARGRATQGDEGRSRIGQKTLFHCQYLL